MTCLETIANPYATVLGPPESGPTRINIAQTLTAWAGFLGRLSEGISYLPGRKAQKRQFRIDAPYLGIAYFCCRAADYLCPVASVPDLPPGMRAAGLVRTRAAQTHRFGQQLGSPSLLGGRLRVAVFLHCPNFGIVLDANPFERGVAPAHEIRPVGSGYSSRSSWSSTKLGPVPAQTLYAGRRHSVPLCRGANGHFQLLRQLRPGKRSRRDQSAGLQWLGVIGFVLFMFGRLCGSAVISQFKPHLRAGGLFGHQRGAGRNYDGRRQAGLVCDVGSFFFMSVMFPTIFALGIRGLGDYTKLGSSLIVMSIVGGAIAPPFMGHIADLHSMRLGFVVPLVCFVLIAIYGSSGKGSRTRKRGLTDNQNHVGALERVCRCGPDQLPRPAFLELHMWLEFHGIPANPFANAARVTKTPAGRC